MKPIYEPRGKAREYGELALNLHNTCPHKCFYCYAPSVIHKPKDEYFCYGGYRPGIVEATMRQIEKEGITDKLIHIPFIGDAYPKGFDSLLTREIIKLVKRSGNHVQILTKNGEDAERDFDLLDGGDWFGVSYAGYGGQSLFSPPKEEPGAGDVAHRLAALERAYKRGIKTWVSCEPVLDELDVIKLIKCADYVDSWKIGKLNYFPSDIDWSFFGRSVEAICKAFGRNYCIKDDLRREMELGK